MRFAEVPLAAGGGWAAGRARQLLGATTAHSTKAFPSHDLGAPPFQAGIAAPHFAEVETEALGRERPSKGGSSEAAFNDYQTHRWPMN